MFLAITHEEVIYKQSTGCSAIDIFNNIIYFDTKKRNRQYTNLRYTHFLFFFFRDKIFPILTLNLLSCRKFLKNKAILASSPRFIRSLTMPYFHVVSYAFSINVFTRIKWSIELFRLLKQDWCSVINSLLSRYQINLALIILSSVLHTQLLRVMGL